MDPERDTAPLHGVEIAGAPRASNLSTWRRKRALLLLLAALCVLILLVLARPAAAPSSSSVPSYPLSGGGSIPAFLMGGDDFAEWFAAAGSGAAIQTFFAYGNGPHNPPQLKRFGRSNVFVSTGIPCGCCGAGYPRDNGRR